MLVYFPRLPSYLKVLQEAHNLRIAALVGRFPPFPSSSQVNILLCYAESEQLPYEQPFVFPPSTWLNEKYNYTSKSQHKERTRDIRALACREARVFYWPGVYLSSAPFCCGKLSFPKLIILQFWRCGKP